MEIFAGDGDNNELENSQMGVEATYKSPSNPIEVRDKVSIFMGAPTIYRGQVGVVQKKYRIKERDQIKMIYCV